MKHLTILLSFLEFSFLVTMNSVMFAQGGYEPLIPKSSYQSRIDSVIEAWAVHFGPDSLARAKDIAVDGSGNIYVTGRSMYPLGFWDYATVKYNSSGIEQWASYYNGTSDLHDEPTDIAIDSQGNVYVTGWSTGLGSQYDYTTIKYNNSGIEQWIASYDGGFGDQPAAIAVDSLGNVYVTGRSIDSTGTEFEYATIKYNSFGIEQWVARYKGPGTFAHAATAIGIDGSGNVYVTGRSWGMGTDYDYATVSYDSSGTERWVSRYNGPGNSRDQAKAMAVDASGNVYVTGWSVGLSSQFDYATIKYNSSGDEQWVARYNGPLNYIDEAKAISIDELGNVYVTGTSNYEYATIKYDSSGTEQWVARFSGPGEGDEAEGIAVDKSGNVYVTGYSNSSGTDYDFATIKYDNSGNEQWVARYNGPGNTDDRAVAIAIDASDNVYVTGFSVEYVANWHLYTTIRYEQTPSSVGENPQVTPVSFTLGQNHPNPFNPSTTISFSLPIRSYTTLKIFDILGRQVSVLVDEELPTGAYLRRWDAQGLASGVYFYSLSAEPIGPHGQAEMFTASKKLLLLR